MSKKIHLLIILALCGCSTTATLELSDLPNPVYIDTETGEATVPPHTEGKPADAIPYSDLITMISESGHSPYIESIVNYGTYSWEEPRINITSNNIKFRAWDTYDYPYVTYFGDRFTRNEYGFAEQTSGRIPAKYSSDDDYVATKLVLGGGATGLKYTDFGYWIGVSENPYTNPRYIAFTMQGGGHQSYTGSTIYATYTGRAAAVAYNNTIPGSARELGGDATLTVSSSSGSNLVLDFDDYYKFTIDSPYSYGNGITSVKVDGTNTNGGPEFTSCTSGCKAYGDIDYYGEYRAEEAVGTYRYIDGTNTLVGSFGAKRD